MAGETMKERIDAMDYKSMLSRWRHAPMGDLMLQGEAGVYFGEEMERKKESLSPGEVVAVSKEIGW